MPQERVVRVTASFSVADSKWAGTKDPVFLGIVIPSLVVSPQLMGGGREWSMSTRPGQEFVTGKRYVKEFCAPEHPSRNDAVPFSLIDVELYGDVNYPPSVYLRKAAPPTTSEDDRLRLAGAEVDIHYAAIDLATGEPGPETRVRFVLDRAPGVTSVALSAESGNQVWLTRVL